MDLTVWFIDVHPGLPEEGRLRGLPGLGTDRGSPATFPAAAG